VRRAALLVLALVAAGCAAPADPENEPRRGPVALEVLATLALPARPYNLATAGDLVLASTAPPVAGGVEPGMGLAVVDARDATRPALLATMRFPGGGVEAVAISDDARWAFVGTEFSGAVGIYTVDLADPASPSIYAFTPLPPDGPHNVRFARIGGEAYVIASISHLNMVGTATPAPQDTDPLHDLRVDIFRFDPAQRAAPLMRVSSYQAEGTQGLPQDSPIIHDAVVQTHPLTGQDVMYVAYWDRGVRLVDVSDPAAPVEMGAMEEMAPADFLIIHTVKPHPTLLDSRHLTVATSQCAYAPQSLCYLRVLDTTDPTRPTQVGTWTLPDEAHGSDITSEIFDLANGTVVVPWLSAGTWALDIRQPAAPRALGHDLDVGAVNAVVVRGDTAWVADIAGSLRVLRLPSLA